MWFVSGKEMLRRLEKRPPRFIKYLATVCLDGPWTHFDITFDWHDPGIQYLRPTG